MRINNENNEKKQGPILEESQVLLLPPEMKKMHFMITYSRLIGDILDFIAGPILDIHILMGARQKGRAINIS